MNTQQLFWISLVATGCTTSINMKGEEESTACAPLEVLETLGPDEVSPILGFAPNEAVAEMTGEGYHQDADRVMQVTSTTIARLLGDAAVQDFGEQDCMSGIQTLLPVSLENIATIEGFAIQQSRPVGFLATSPSGRCDARLFIG